LARRSSDRLTNGSDLKLNFDGRNGREYLRVVIAADAGEHIRHTLDHLAFDAAAFELAALQGLLAVDKATVQGSSHHVGTAERLGAAFDD
jgi:hypothetical protein